LGRRHFLKSTIQTELRALSPRRKVLWPEEPHVWTELAGFAS
jgi:hypothetical protein